MANIRVNLFENNDSGVKEIMAGPWESIRVENLPGGQEFHLDGRVVEHCLFTLEGTGSVSEPDGRSWSFEKGNTISLPLGGQAFITPDSGGMKVLIITMNVDH